MRKVKAIPITKEAFAPYGQYYNLLELPAVEAEGFRCHVTKEVINDNPMNFGFTLCKGNGDFQSVSMERHFLTMEPQFCGDGDMVLTVADSDPEICPREEDVVAFLMKPGDVAVLNRGIWHDANHGVDKDTLYYFLAENSTDPRETEFVSIEPEAVLIEVKREGD